MWSDLSPESEDFIWTRQKGRSVIFAVFAALIVVAAGLSFLIPWLGAATEMPELVELSVLSDGAGNTP